MGVNNKARRAAKARQRAKQRAHRAPPRAGGWHDARDPDDIVVEGPGGMSARAMRRAGIGASDEERERAALERMWADHELRLHRLLGAVWDGGWQPVELVREVRRSTRGPLPVDLVRRLIAVDHARQRPGALHPRWRAQVDSLDLPELPAAPGWLAGALRDHPRAHVSAPIVLLNALSGLGRLPRLVPPPGGSPSDVDIDLAAGAGAERSDPVLARVRALLAQAESTSFPAEAEAFTAKAHELMTRHAIDAALLDGSAAAAGWATAVRIAVDEPYVDSKLLLLQIVAEHSRCKAVFHSRYAMSTVVGASDDLGAVELLFTSLLLQGQHALLAEGSTVEAGARERSRTFRASFLFAYANRIGERLAEVTAAVVADVESGGGVAVLPVLADRARGVDEVVDRLFGDLVASPVRAGWDAAGWSSGRRAADRARLSQPDLDGADPAEAAALTRPAAPTPALF